MSAVEAVRRAAEERATAQILALEKSLERERRRAARSLAQVQRRLERAAGTATVSDTRVDAAERMLTDRELPAEARRDVDAGVRDEVEVAPGPTERRLSPELSLREQELTREREAARRAADDAQVSFDKIVAQIEAASARIEGAETRLGDEAARLAADSKQRLDAQVTRIREQADAATAAAVERVRADTEARMRSEAEARLEAQAAELKAEADGRVHATAESVRAETEKSYRAEIDALRSDLAEPQPTTATKKVVPEKTPGSDAETRVHHLVNLNEATFEQLRAMDMSVIQATRVIAYRERQDGFDSIDDLDSVPGFPKPFLEKLKQQLSA